MRIRELSLRNYRVFEEVDLELPARVIGIFGGNGYGKSTLVEAIQWACYGRARTAKDEIRTHGVLTDCEVRVVFEHAGRPYEVRRSIRGKNHHTDAELYVGDLQLASGVTDVDAEIQRLLRMDVHVFRASVFAEQKQLDAFSDVTKGKRKEMVLRLLGIRPVDDARATARKEARDTRGDAERLAGTLPDLSEQEEELAGAREAAAAAEQRASEAAAEVREAEARVLAAEDAFEEGDAGRQRVEKLAVEVTHLRQQEGDLEAQERQLSGRLEQLRRALRELPSLEEEARRLAGAPDRLAVGRRVAELASELSEAEAELRAVAEVDIVAALAELERARDEHRAAERAATRAEAALDRAREDLAAAEEALARAGQADPTHSCPTCGRPLGDDFREYLRHCRAAVAESKERAAEAGRSAGGATGALKAAEARLRAATARGEEARRADQTRTQLSDRLTKDRRRLTGMAQSFGGEVPDVGSLEAEARRAAEVNERLSELRGERKRLADAETALEGATASLKRCRTRIEDLDREAAGLAFDPEDHRRLRKERDESRRVLEEVRGRERQAASAVAASREAVSRLEGAIQQARETAARAAALRERARYEERVSLLLDGFRDHLVSRIGPELSREAEALFRELTNHEYEDLRIDEETLDIRIADGTEYFGTDRFSGSETDLANLALRVAISVHLSRVSGADLGMMVLDEVLASLDAERKDLFVQAMGRLAGRFHQLFVITHAEQVKDQFPASIEVRRTGRRRSTAFLR